ncbi:hypothetical protein EsH8_IX_000827 [Colletotrichum jinshuiense]
MLTQIAPRECEVVQPASPRGQSMTPLFLMHDGGGTTFAYHCLSPLDRAVFGIANPRFHSGVPWAGGLPEMAAAYLQMIRYTVTKGHEFPALAPYSYSSAAGADGKTRRRRKILLGGWSLGGLLSLEIARQLGPHDDDIEVVGLVMVDSVYPVWPEGSRAKIAWFADGDDETEGKNQKLAKRAMKMARGVVKQWKMPRCGAAPPPPAPAPRANGGEAESGTGPEEEKEIEKDFYGSREDMETAEIVWERPPRAVLVRAKDPVPMPTEGISSVDVYRGDEKLGWEGYCPGFVEKSLETQGNHFDMFAWGYVEGITEKIAEACQMLEKSD